MTRPRSLAVLAAASSCLALAAAGCGSGAYTSAPTTATLGETATTPASADEQAVRDVADRFFAAYLAGDGDAACALYSHDGEEQLVRQGSDFGHDCPTIAEAAARFLNRALGGDIEPMISGVKVTGDRASATVILKAPNAASNVAAEPSMRTFERVDGTWLVGPELG